MRRVLVTGANGYLGSNIVHSLWEYNDVTPLTRQQCDLKDIDATTKWFRNTNMKYDVLIHCASVGGSRLKEDTNVVYSENMNMFLNLHANKQFFKKIVYLNSGAALHRPEEPYGKAKGQIADIIRDQYNVHEREIITIFNIFDHNEMPTRFISTAIERALLRYKSSIFVDNKFMSFYYMKDFIEVIKQSLFLHAEKRDYCLAYEQTPPKLKEIAQFIKDISKKEDLEIVEFDEEPIYYGPRTDDVLSPYFYSYENGLWKGIEKTFNILKARRENKPKW